jgi:hypothetical protein
MSLPKFGGSLQKPTSLPLEYKYYIQKHCFGLKNKWTSDNDNHDSIEDCGRTFRSNQTSKLLHILWTRLRHEQGIHPFPKSSSHSKFSSDFNLCAPAQRRKPNGESQARVQVEEEDAILEHMMGNSRDMNETRAAKGKNKKPTEARSPCIEAKSSHRSIRTRIRYRSKKPTSK